jgi:hypothetical protein
MVRDNLQSIISEVSSWEGVTSTPHRFGGTEFSLGKVEIGHVHSGGLVDIPYTRKIRDALVADGQAQPHHLLEESGWISFYVRGGDDVAQAMRLFRLSYLHKRDRRDHTFNAVTYHDELARLGFSDTVMNALPSVENAN